ncbi:MAG: NIPSNAP family containing protein [Acidimicrobiia bacterium]|nr:NIPSNAP family containing protein [Acidimicrobiia bacterium]
MNTKVYIHELIRITGRNRARYMHHMTANWCPEARKERHQLCYGVWGTVGSTGRWPEVVNLWEIDGWHGLAADFAHELGHPGLQDPALAEWWDAAESLRAGGIDRLLVPTPQSATIEALCADGVRGEVYAHDLVTVPAGRALSYLELVETHADAVADRYEARLLGAFRVAMVADTEAVVLWAFPSHTAWADWEQAWLGGGSSADDPVGALRSAALDVGATWRRWLMADAPLAPLRLGRQPEVGDRRRLDEL